MKSMMLTINTDSVRPQVDTQLVDLCQGVVENLRKHCSSGELTAALLALPDRSFASLYGLFRWENEAAKNLCFAEYAFVCYAIFQTDLRYTIESRYQDLMADTDTWASILNLEGFFSV